jgi:hypothetical protein
MHKKIVWLSLLGILIVAPAHAQLNQLFGKIFNEVLVEGFQATGTGVHQDHFKIPAAKTANERLTIALNSLIARNVSSLPLPSTSAGVTVDFSTGQIVRISESLGPIFAETAQTLGKGRINMGINYTYLNLAELRGVSTQDIRFAFTHQDVLQSGLGDSPNESDIVNLVLGLDVNVNIFAAFGTYGLTNNFDVSVLLPFVNVNLSGEALAVIDSYTFALQNGYANHRFNADSLNPDLDDNVPYNESAGGLGDIGLRLKYSFLRGTEVESAALLDVRLPTGDEKDFLGTGKTNVKLTWILSKKIDDFFPHFNLGYARRSADFDSDQLELTLGFTQKVMTGLNFAAEFIGQFDLDSDEVVTFFPEVTTPIAQRNNSTQARYVKQVDLSNIPERSNDNTLIASFGFRAAPSDRIMFLGNVLLSLNDGGLRSSVAPTVGATISF